MKKITIKNRKGLKLVILPEIKPKQKGLVFIMHGFGGFKEQKHIQAMANAFKKEKYSIVRFDTTNSLGESGGKTIKATITQYYNDLKDVINWSSKQNWYIEPFTLAGHSAGGQCILFFAENYPLKVKALVPFGANISSQLLRRVFSKKELDVWKNKGYKERVSHSKAGVIIKTSWLFMLDMDKYDILKKTHELTMPILLIVGSQDDSCPVYQQRMLYKKLPGPKELNIIKGAPHTFRENKHLIILKRLIKAWVKKYL
ncbi:MAG: alpha/beta fold hydrolase [Patescibacteria group bacterium]